MSYDAMPEASIIEKTANAIGERGIEVIVVENGADALAKIKEFIPAGASVNNGSSITLRQIGFIDYLKDNQHGWNNLHEAIILEKDPEKQAALRKEAVFSDYYLGSVHAVTQTGELIIASASGSQLPHIVFTSQNLIFVVGIQKITPTYDDAIKRIREYVVPLEDVRMKEAGMGGTVLSKILTIENEPSFMGRKVRLIFVKEQLGF
jgi:hypothetical protein